MINVPKSKILVIGSSNTDMVIKTSRFPIPGETVLGGEFFMNHGGKGANQAVAAARLGGEVSFICKIGKDDFGSNAVKQFDREGINTSCVLMDLKYPSGVALITVNEDGDNCIVVAPGANGHFTSGDLERISEEISHADIILLQLEIPIEVAKHIILTSSNLNKKLILNPAPCVAEVKCLIDNVYLLTPNEIEAAVLSGIKITDLESAKEAAKIISGLGVKNIVITMGARGALLYTEGEFELIKSEKVKAIDTTAAGDVFNGALAVAISRGLSLVESVKFASKAAAISVTRQGAQTSAPYHYELV